MRPPDKSDQPERAKTFEDLDPAIQRQFRDAMKQSTGCTAALLARHRFFLSRGSGVRISPWRRMLPAGDPAVFPWTMRYVRTVVKTLDCANFCAHPTDRWAHLRTASHMLRSQLSCFVSAATLKTGRLFSVGLLPWAQEVRGSNPRAPTTYFFVFNSLCLT